MPDPIRGAQPALDEVARTDLLLDALAARTEHELDAHRDFDNLDDHALAMLMGDWRDDLRWPPASALVSQDEAEEALREGMRDRPTGRRGLAAVGSVAATLLMLSGFGAVVADARPGDLLYGLHAMMFNEPRVSDDQIELSAKADMAKAEQMIAQGQWDQAQTQLNEVSSALQAVNDGSRRQGLLDEVNQLNTRVERHEPKASGTQPDPAGVPPSAPKAPPVNSLTPALAPGLTAPPLAPGLTAPPLAPGLTPPLAPSPAPPLAPGGHPQPPAVAPAPNQGTSTVPLAPTTSAPVVTTSPPQTPPQTASQTPKPSSSTTPSPTATSSPTQTQTPTSTTTVPTSSAATTTPSAAPSPTDTPTTTTKAKHRHRGQTEATETPAAAPSGPATSGPATPNAQIPPSAKP